MSAKLNQYSVSKEQLYFFYRFTILPWELTWSNQKFLLAEGDLKKFCQCHNINIKSFDSASKLSEAISTDYEIEAKIFSGLFWFVKKETKPKDMLRQLRNCFAHGNYEKRQKNRASCLVIENIDKGVVKAKGFLPFEKLKSLIKAASSCGI